MAGDYAAQAFTQLSSTFLPVLVVSLLGAAQGAYYLPAQTAFAAMGMLATAITSSLARASIPPRPRSSRDCFRGSGSKRRS